MLNPEPAIVLRDNLGKLNARDQDFARSLLVPRRMDDRNPSLWHTINVLQENCLRGGLSGRVFTPGAGSRRATTKQINGIDQTVKVNAELWKLGAALAKELA